MKDKRPRGAVRRAATLNAAYMRKETVMKDQRNRDAILSAATLNASYMRLSAGETSYGMLKRLYQRIADESVTCATAFCQHDMCPPHRASVDAFWWAIVAWARNIGYDIMSMPGAPWPLEIWNEAFVKPHLDFARYLRRLYVYHDRIPRDVQLSDLSALGLDYPFVRNGREITADEDTGRVILEHDIQWMFLVIKLTVKWGLLSHLRWLPVLAQAFSLAGQLGREHRENKVARAYLESDLVFLTLLFSYFEMDEELQKTCASFLGGVKLKQKER